MTTTPIRSHGDVVVAALAATGLNVFRGRGPDDPAGTVPYAVVYAAGLRDDGPAGAPHADWSPTVQVTAVGDSEAQAEWVADRVYAVMTGPLVPPAGRDWLCPVDVETVQPAHRDEEVSPALFHLAGVYTLHSTPA